MSSDDMSREARLGPASQSEKRSPKLTLAQAQEIRDEYAIGGVTLQQLGAAFGVSTSAVSQIVKGKLRLCDYPLRGSSSPRARLTEAAIVDIRRRASAGQTLASIAEMYGVHAATVSYVVRRRTWSHVP